MPAGATGLSFEQLAGAIDERVTAEYQENFEELAGLALGAGAPSARTLELLRQYANLRTDASHALAEGLRAKRPGQDPPGAGGCAARAAAGPARAGTGIGGVGPGFRGFAPLRR
jgi:hypothetical protein